MSFPTSTVHKPTLRRLPPDWHRHNENTFTATTAARDAAVALRQEAQAARSKAHVTSRRSADHSTSELFDRAYEINRVKKDLESHLQKVVIELARLESAKAVTEAECEARVPPFELVLQCLSIREERREEDLVKDQVERCLHKEASVLQSSRGALEKLAMEALELRRQLEIAKRDLEEDIKDKSAALVIDTAQAALTPHGDVSYKPDPLPTSSTLALRQFQPYCGLSERDWLDNSTDNMRRAQDAITNSQDMRGKICMTVQSTKADDEHQQRSTDFALRQRRQQQQHAFEDLQWQRQELEEQAARMEAEINNLERELGSTGLLLKTAHTRLEERKARPPRDLVTDVPYDALLEEERRLRNTRDNLREKLANARSSLHELQHRLRAVHHDLGVKSLSVSLDAKVGGVREALPVNVTTDKLLPQSLTEKNMALTGCRQHYPTEILD